MPSNEIKDVVEKLLTAIEHLTNMALTDPPHSRDHLIDAGVAVASASAALAHIIDQQTIDRVFGPRIRNKRLTTRHREF